MNKIRYTVEIPKKPRKKVRKKYPNLAKSKVYLILTKFTYPEKISEKPVQKQKKIIEKAIKKQAIVNTNYKFNKKEKAIIISESDKTEIKISIPEKIRETSEKQKGKVKITS